MPSNKKYYWLKLHEKFFNQTSMKYIRKLPEGEKITIIYLKLLLASLKTDGYIYLEGLFPTIEEELALHLDEELMSVQFSIAALEKTKLIPMFILDFLCIHPFNDGNGRMGRLLTLLLFYKAGYIVGKYVSIEMLIEKTKETYYEALQESSNGWHENENSYESFVKYYLGIILKAYSEFEGRVEHLKNRSLSKPDRIKAVIDNKVGKITKKEIMELCPDISKVTVERTLTELVKSGYIAKVGAGPATGYVRI